MVITALQNKILIFNIERIRSVNYFLNFKLKQELCLLLNANAGIIFISCCLGIRDMRRLTTGIRSEKCVVRRFRPSANVIQCTYTNLDSIAYYTPSLYGIPYCS
jgi:hypothetical protein